MGEGASRVLRPVSGTDDRPVLSFRRQRPEPSRFWIRHRPARWPAADGPWLDLATGRLESGGTAGEPPPFDGALDRLDDLVYLPPVAASHAGWRDRLAAALVERGLAVLVQLLPEQAAPRAAGAIVCLDPLPGLLAGHGAAAVTLPAGGVVAYGLIAGRTDSRELLAATAERLAAAGAATLVPLAVELTPRQKRLLAGDDERAFERLFHGPPPSERAAARVVADRRLTPFFDRPPLGGRPDRQSNRRLAARLVQIADLWLRLGKAEAPAQELFRAARWIERSEHDLAALARDGNLGVLSWLEGPARRQLEAALDEDPPRVLGELRAAWLEGGGEGAG